ncbi:hypothetical protein TcasGA2_TC001589 [Tribolium castaneum]|uniref:Helitron helicase-like domain-containing protein n=1 Tax=Tribolium castaneum TaxID=7070 RepID=D7EL66_TRICA|nr:hypothetical protein TcasGA2_TC001589 [Tribolium castaneum]
MSQMSRYHDIRAKRMRKQEEHQQNSDTQLQIANEEHDDLRLIVCVQRDEHIEELARNVTNELSVNIIRDPIDETRIQEMMQNDGDEEDNDKRAEVEEEIIRPVRVVVPPRRRHAEVPIRRTYRLALRTQNIEAVEAQYMGQMTSICDHCNALFFENERLPITTRGRFFCCNFGKVRLPDLVQCPRELKRLLTENTQAANNFREHIRSANSLFAMASFKATIPEDRNQNQDYKRPNNGRTIDYEGTAIDNRRIVPYNKYLSGYYDCDINVECCGSIYTIKYLHKYVEKNADYITVKAQHQQPNEDGVINWDEVIVYQDYRYVSST